MPELPEATEGEGVLHLLQESVWPTPRCDSDSTKLPTRKSNMSRKKLTEAEIANLFRQIEGQSSDEQEAEFVAEHVYCSFHNYKLKLLPYSNWTA